MLNETISQFNILEKLGQGGMGIVYKAWDSKLERTVAIKVLHKEYALQKKAKDQFILEAKAAARLNHPNIATIHQIEESNGELFIVMEYVDGIEIKKRIKKKGCFPVDMALEYAFQIADGIIAAHEKGIAHYDIKSSNIMITKNGRIKIMDFGLAMFFNQLIPAEQTNSSGSVQYMSPEQISGKVLDYRSDIWSFGVILYELITGKLPFSPVYDQSVIYCILNTDPAPFKNLQDPRLLKINKVINKALQKHPADRYQNMKELLAELNLVSDTGISSFTSVKKDHSFVGRKKELNVLNETVKHTFSGESSIIGISGEPGIGKTALVKIFIEEMPAKVRNSITTTGQCSERLAGNEAYLPFLESMNNLLKVETDINIEESMRKKAPWWYSQIAELNTDNPDDRSLNDRIQNVTQEQIKREMSLFLMDLSTINPIVILFEDIHWADVSTIDMIAYLASKFDSMRLMMIVTFRPEEMKLSANSFLKIKPDLKTKNQYKEIELALLPKKETTEYLSIEFTNHRFPNSFSDLIYDKTEGSPLFLIDLLRDLQNQKVILRKDNVWQLTKPLNEIKLELPASVKGMVEMKINRLNKNDHQLLQAASIQGFEFDSAIVGKLLETGDKEIEERLSILENDHRFLQFTGEYVFPDLTVSMRYRFVHALYQNEVFSSLQPTKRSRLCQKAAENLENLYTEKSEKISAQLAKLYESAHNIEKAVDYYSLASKHSSTVFAHQEAIQLAEQGLKLLNKLPDTYENNVRELTLQAFLGGSISAIKGYADNEVGKAFVRVQDLSKIIGLNKHTAVAVAGLLPYLIVTLQLNKALDLSKELLNFANKEEDKLLLGIANSGRGFALQFRGKFPEAQIAMEKVINVNEPDKQDTSALMGWQTIVYTLGHLALNFWIIVYPDKAKEVSALAQKKAEESSNPFMMVHYYSFANFLYQYLGDHNKILELSQKCIEVSEENAFHLNKAWAIMQQGWAISKNGNTQKGLLMLQEGLHVWRMVGMAAMVPYWHILMTEMFIQLNKPKDGIPLMDEALDVIKKNNHGLYESEVYRMYGLLLFHIKEDDAKIEPFYRKSLEKAREQKAKSFELRTVINLCQLWQKQGRNDKARKLLKESCAWFNEGLDTADYSEANRLLKKLS